MNNKELKFRIWDYANKEFCDWVALSKDGLKFGCSFNFEKLSEFSGSPVCGLDQERFEIQQFTGLKDKNEREIYEGDIVLDSLYNNSKNSEKDKFIVRFYYGSFNLDVIWGGYGGFKIHNNLEIIGNIFENSEFLKI